jgi:hypothetical protein
VPAVENLTAQIRSGIIAAARAQSDTGA